MALTPAQLATLKADILADPAFTALRSSPDGRDAIRAAYGQFPAADYWVWRSNVSRAEIYNNVSPDSTTWNWTTYKNQPATEQNAWTQMFMGDQADFSKANLRAGVAAIFTGSAQATAQRDHVLAMGRRKATRAEKLFASGAGSTVAPATMTFEGALSFADVDSALNLP